jgi:hypothetical protein
MLKIQIFICLFLLSISWDINPKLLTPAQDFPLIGIWQKQTSPAVIFTFMTVVNKQQYDYKDDLEIHVQGFYELHGKQIYFNDIEGNKCDSTGIYIYNCYKDTLKFSLVRDGCEGRINGISGIWIRKKND